MCVNLQHFVTERVKASSFSLHGEVLTGYDFRYAKFLPVMTACGRCCLSENISRTTAARALPTVAGRCHRSFFHF